MAGNELEVCKFLLANIGRLRLNHIGVISEIAAPLKQSSDVIVIKSENDLSSVSGKTLNLLRDESKLIG